MLYGIKDASSVRVDSLATLKPVLYAPYCNTTDISFTSESTFASIKGVKTIRWDHNREGSFKTEFEVLDLAWISLLFGTSFAAGVVPIAKREVLSVTSASALMVGTAKASSLVIFKLDTGDNLTHLTEQTAGLPASAENTYSISSKTITLNSTTFSDNLGKIVLYYLEDSVATAKSFAVKVDNWPGNYKLYGDTTVRGQDGNDKLVQFCLPNCKPKSNVTLNFSSSEATKLSIEWDLFPDAASGEMMKFIKDY